jgi:hypothetical protein
MPSLLNITQNALVSGSRKEMLENVRFLDEVLGSLKIMTLMMSRLQPIPDSAANLAQAEYTVGDVQLGGAIIARLYYNQLYGVPDGFQYNMTKLIYVYNTYDIPWDEPVTV